MNIKEELSSIESKINVLRQGFYNWESPDIEDAMAIIAELLALLKECSKSGE